MSPIWILVGLLIVNALLELWREVKIIRRIKVLENLWEAGSDTATKAWIGEYGLRGIVPTTDPNGEPTEVVEVERRQFCHTCGFPHLLPMCEDKTAGDEEKVACKDQGE